MAKNIGNKSIGAWAFLVGVIIVLILAIFSSSLSENVQGWAVAIILLVGLVVGFMNITRGESTKFILATVALVIVSSMGANAIGSSLMKLSFLSLGEILGNVLTYLMILIVPALIIVALKSIFEVAKD